jgi:hypothetical protein
MIQEVSMATTTRITVRSAGGSLIATIPKEVVDAEGLRAGDVIGVTFQSRREALRQLAGSVPGVVWDRSTRRDRF